MGMGATEVTTAYRERAAQQMPNAPFQRIILRAVVDRQIDADFGNFHITHDAVSGNIELAVVVGRCSLQALLAVGCCCAGDKGVVVGIGKLLCFEKIAVIRLLHNLLVGGVNLGGILLVDIITYNRIQSQPQRQQERHDRQSDCDTLLLRKEPSFFGIAPED